MAGVFITADLRQLDPDRPRGASAYATALVADLLRLDTVNRYEVLEPGSRRQPHPGATVHLSLDGSGQLSPRQHSVVAIYDLSHLTARRSYGLTSWAARSLRAAWTVRQSSLLLAPSASIRDQLVRFLRSRADRVLLVPPRPPAFGRAARREVEAVRAEFHLPRRYFLFVGTLTRRKNLPLLLDAWRTASHSLGVEVGLVLAGVAEGEGDPAGLALAVPGTRWVGYVPGDRLPALITGAVAWLNPSLHEGCAQGVLESMACGTPPVVSGAGALREPLGDAGMVLDPGDAGAWSAAITLLAHRADLRATLSARGLRAIASMERDAEVLALSAAL